MQSPIRRFIVLSAIIALITPSLSAEPQDSSPVDMAQLLQALKTMREQQLALVKANRQKAMRDVQAAAASGSAAAAAWEEAGKQVQFDGIAHEGSAFREWKDKEGE